MYAVLWDFDHVKLKNSKKVTTNSISSGSTNSNKKLSYRQGLPVKTLYDTGLMTSENLPPP